MGGTSEKVFMDTSTFHFRGSSDSSFRNTSANSFTTWIFFNRGLSPLEFKMYARYPIHHFLSSFLAVTTDSKLIWLGVLSPS
jgi:hypothetical protein